MSIAEAVIEKLNALPPEKQEQVLIYVESMSRPEETPAKTGKPLGFLGIALQASLQGPADWSEHLDDYLYGDRRDGR